MVVAVRHRTDGGQVEHHFGLHFAERALDGKLVAQIAKNNLHSMFGAENVAAGHIALQRVKIVPADLRETLQQAAADKSCESCDDDSHPFCFFRSSLDHHSYNYPSNPLLMRARNLSK